MDVSVPVAVFMPMVMNISVSVRVLVHSSVFYVHTVRRAALVLSPLLDG